MRAILKSNSTISDSSIFIRNNTCDNSPQWDGISVYGVPDAEDAGFISLENNMVSNNGRCGLVLANGYMYADVRNTGYYNNYTNKNYAFEEDDPVVLTQNPYETGTGFMPVYYIDQTCALIDAGCDYIEETRLIGKTTAADGYPDSNIVDIGFHYPNWDFSNAGTTTLKADFDNDCKVDFNDLAMFAGYWLYDYQENYDRWWWDFDDSGIIDFNDLTVIADYWLTYFDFHGYADFAQYWRQEVDYRFENTKYDLKEDGFVDFKDFTILADEWQQTGNIVNLSVELSQEPNLVSGELGVTLIEHSEELFYYLFVDGGFKAMFPGDSAAITTEECRNGPHEVKIVALSISGEIWIGSPVEFFTNNRVSCYTGVSAYKYNEDYHFSGFYNSGGESVLQLRLEDVWGDVVWSDSATGDFDFIIPNSVLDTSYNELIMEETALATAGNEIGMDSEWPGYIKEIVKKFDIADPGASDAKSLLVLKKGGFWKNWPKNRKQVWREFLNTCQRRGLSPTIILY